MSWVFDVNYMKDRSHGPISTLDHEVDTSVAFNRSDLGDENNYAFEWKGYIQAPATGNFNFFAAVDDDCIVWIGAPATATTLGSTTSDYLFAQTGGTRNGSTQGIAMTANKCIQSVFGSKSGQDQNNSNLEQAVQLTQQDTVQVEPILTLLTTQQLKDINHGTSIKQKIFCQY